MANCSNNVGSRLDGGTAVADISEEPEDEPMDVRFIVVGKKCRNNTALQQALKHFDSPIIYSDTGLEFINEADYDTVFVVDNFDGDLFQRLHRAGCRILGPPVLIKCAKNNEMLPYNARPLYCTLMRHLVLCFTGFKVKEDLSRMAELVHHMGGSIRKDFSSRVTHLVANCTGGEKYRVAVSMGTCIMTEDWVYKSWDHKEDVDLLSTEEALMHYKMSPFFFSVLSFYGFSKDERSHMEEISVENGGSCVEAGSPSCTHLVVDEHSIKSIPFETHPKLHIVKSEWFWASIQMDACADESMYTYRLCRELVETPTASNGKTTPKTLSGSKSRKRKRLRENLAQLASEGEVDTPMYKRRSSEVARMSFSASFLDATADTSGPNLADAASKENLHHGISSPSLMTPALIKESKISPRQQITNELFHTEKNYVGILHTVLKTFKEEIERSDQPGGPLLDATDVKLIFGKIPPIYDTHMKMRDELNDIINNWRNDRSVGDVILKHAEALTKFYPPFVNFFESTKETIVACEKRRPRFHAFLKVCQGRPECGRQALTELLIRPVQRLPSVLLLLKDILKRTELTNPDHEKLNQAISTLEEVMTHINEEKGKTEGHQTMFDIMNDIENCPPYLLSAHRKFIMKIDVMELTEELSGRGDSLSLFIFSDLLEMCKRRVKVLNSKSPASHGSKTPQKAYKHLCMLPFSSIKRVVDIFETPDCKYVFTLITKKMDEEEKLYAFTIVDEVVKKDEFLTNLTKAICANMCRADYETLLTTVEPHVLSVDTSDMGTKTLSKAATRFSKRVSRAFSFNKTPRKLRRAMSSMTQMMSPFRRDSNLLMNPHTTTPRSDLRAMRLASTNDLTDETLLENVYSELVDQMSIGTPVSQRRRDTLVGINYAKIKEELNHKPKRKKLKHRLSILSSESPISAITGTSLTPMKSATIGTAAGGKFY